MSYLPFRELADSLVTNLPQAPADGSTISKALTIMFGIVGALAFLMIIIGGFRYIIAQDDPQKISQAKSTILYAIIGMIVAGLGETIVTYVLGSFKP